ncbi:MAG: hypothetical protein LBG44_06510 [Gemmatimonadota bacterium]|jgi:hypothetical protein|nr:hypothetical protein [Gemmatimonadota bacterium]
MGLFDWLWSAGGGEGGKPEDLSRRAFFARMAGRESGVGSAPESLAGAAGGETPSGIDPDPPEPEDPNVLHTFQIANFPYHDGPVLVPILRVGDEYRLDTDPPYSRDPSGLRILRGKSCLGTIPPAIFPEILDRIRNGETIICRAHKVDPGAELAKILTVQLVRIPPEPEPEVDPEMESVPEVSGLTPEAAVEAEMVGETGAVVEDDSDTVSEGDLGA